MSYFRHKRLREFENTHAKNSTYICLGGVNIRKSDPLLKKLANIGERHKNHAERHALENSLWQHIKRKRKEAREKQRNSK